LLAVSLTAEHSDSLDVAVLSRTGGGDRDLRRRLAT